MVVYLGVSTKFGKKTLYLDLESIKRIEIALKKIPGRPSVSALLNSQLPLIAEMAESMAAAVETRDLGLVLKSLADTKMTIDRDASDVYLEINELQQQLKSTTKGKEQAEE